MKLTGHTVQFRLQAPCHGVARYKMFRSMLYWNVGITRRANEIEEDPGVDIQLLFLLFESNQRFSSLLFGPMSMLWDAWSAQRTGVERINIRVGEEGEHQHALPFPVCSPRTPTQHSTTSSLVWPAHRMFVVAAASRVSGFRIKILFPAHCYINNYVR